MERQTRQRRVILDTLGAEDRPLSINEILQYSKNKIPSMGVATVYRTVKEFVDNGIVAEVRLPGDSKRYELSTPHHHHHFWCRVCDRVFQVNGCPGELNFHPPTGFKAEGHEVTFKGLCASCLNT